MPQFITSPFERLSEADLRHACGPRVFAQADLLERTDHVVKAGAEEGLLVGQVRGTWRRVEAVEVAAQGARLAPSCTCGAGGFCRHVGALLLFWVRQRENFAPSATPDRELARFATTSTAALQHIGGLLSTRAMTLSEELTALLESHTVAELREIARARGISVPKSRGKAEVVALLASALASPESVDAALAQLDSNARLALDVVQLCGPGATLGDDDDYFDEDEDDFGLPDDVVGDIFVSLGGTGSPPITTLTERGLVFASSATDVNARFLRIPRAVCARLRPLDYLLDDSTVAEAPPSATLAQPAIDGLFLAVASALGEDGIPVSTAGHRQSGFRGWETVPMGKKARVNPLHPRLDANARALLAERSGLAPDAGEFVIELMAAIGIVEAKSHLAVRPDRLQRYFQRSIAERWHTLDLAWQSLDEWSELLLICDTAGPFALSARGPFPHYTLPLIDEASAFRGFLTRLLARLGPDRWYGLDDLLALIDQLVDDVDAEPFALTSRPPLALASLGFKDPPGWWLAERDQPDSALDLTDPEVLERYYHVLTRALLTGPLSWLGVVEVAERGAAGLNFRVRPGARALLAGDALAGGRASADVTSEIQVSDDLAILVPSRTTDAEVYRFLGEIGEFTGVTREGLGYRLTAERAQQLFDGGMSGPQLVEYLTERARRLPPAARKQIERWWSSYGTVQLYDDLTLIELGDDYLLPELLATSSLDKVLIHTFSPRLIAVESGAADALRAELERLGHTPRVVEGE